MVKRPVQSGHFEGMTYLGAGSSRPACSQSPTSSPVLFKFARSSDTSRTKGGVRLPPRRTGGSSPLVRNADSVDINTTDRSLGRENQNSQINLCAAVPPRALPTDMLSVGMAPQRQARRMRT